MSSSMHLLTSQKIISTRQFQSQFAKMLKNAEEQGIYYNVVRNGESVGVFLPTCFWESLMEDMEAMASPNYIASIAESRAQFERGEFYTMDEVFGK